MFPFNYYTRTILQSQPIYLKSLYKGSVRKVYRHDQNKNSSTELTFCSNADLLSEGLTIHFHVLGGLYKIRKK